MPLTRLARAKLNLWLEIVGRRDDGYHLLNSLAVFVDLADTIEVAPAGGLSLAVRGPLAGALEGKSDNLALRAARRLADGAGVAPRAAITLVKSIPVAAGLGGGSADAAATLQALVELWRLALPQDELFDLAATLGADVPMCLAGRPVFVGGVGERLRPAPPLPPFAVLLVNPGVALATSDVFAARRGPFREPVPPVVGWHDPGAFLALLRARANDLEAPAIACAPVVGDLLGRLRASAGVRYAAMSGSGATCFALYDSDASARAVAATLPDGWWRHVGTWA